MQNSIRQQDVLFGFGMDIIGRRSMASDGLEVQQGSGQPILIGGFQKGQQTFG